MASRNILIGSYTSRIPRVDLVARRVLVTKNPSSIFENEGSESYETFTASNCTVQPASGQDLLVLDEGLRDRETYTIFTDTVLLGVQEGTNRKGDQVEYDGLTGTSWFSVVTSKKHNVGVIPHFECLIVKEPEGS